MKQNGFSLLEILITLSIASLLATLAYPQYQQQIKRQQQRQVRWHLKKIALEMEHYCSQHHSYQGATAQIHPNDRSIPQYRFAITSKNPHAFTITATPTVKNAHSQCQHLSVDGLVQELNQQPCHSGLDPESI